MKSSIFLPGQTYAVSLDSTARQFLARFIQEVPGPGPYPFQVYEVISMVGVNRAPIDDFPDVIWIASTGPKDRPFDLLHEWPMALTGVFKLFKDPNEVNELTKSDIDAIDRGEVVLAETPGEH